MFFYHFLCLKFFLAWILSFRLLPIVFTVAEKKIIVTILVTVIVAIAYNLVLIQPNIIYI